MRQGSKISFGILSFWLFAIGCNSYTPKNPGGPADASNVAGGSSPDFAYVQKNILQPQCVMCHSAAGGNGGGVNLENYANAKRSIDKIKSAALEKQTMPPGRPLPAGLQQVLASWISAGAPEQVMAPAAAPVNPPAVEPTYTSIVNNIFTPKCIACHRPGGVAPQPAVLDHADLLAKKWIVPGDPSKSPLYKSLEDGSMPPGDHLSDAELGAISQWIKDGAPNN